MKEKDFATDEHGGTRIKDGKKKGQKEKPRRWRLPRLFLPFLLILLVLLFPCASVSFRGESLGLNGGLGLGVGHDRAGPGPGLEADRGRKADAAIGGHHNRRAGRGITRQALVRPFGGHDPEVLQVHTAAQPHHVFHFQHHLVDGAEHDGLAFGRQGTERGQDIGEDVGLEGGVVHVHRGSGGFIGGGRIDRLDLAGDIDRGGAGRGGTGADVAGDDGEHIRPGDGGAEVLDDEAADIFQPAGQFRAVADIDAVLFQQVVGDEDFHACAGRGHIFHPVQFHHVRDDIVTVAEQLRGQAGRRIRRGHLIGDEGVADRDPRAAIAIHVVAHAEIDAVAQTVTRDDLRVGLEQTQAHAAFGIGGDVGKRDREVAGGVGDVFDVGFNFQQGRYDAGPAHQDVVAVQIQTGHGVFAGILDDGDGRDRGFDRVSLDAAAEVGGRKQQMFLQGGDADGRTARRGAVEHAFIENLLERAGIVAGQVDRNRAGGRGEGRGDEQRLTGGGEGDDLGLETRGVAYTVAEGLGRQGCASGVVHRHRIDGVGVGVNQAKGGARAGHGSNLRGLERKGAGDSDFSGRQSRGIQGCGGF
jgi:hypothetical protein